MYAAGWLQICLSAVIAGEDLTVARLAPFGQRGSGHERVEQRLVEPDLLGGHRAAVELVDLIRELGRDRGLGLGAPEHEDAVECTHRVFGFDARPRAVVGEARDELRAADR